MREDSTTPNGSCQCGCGKPTTRRFASGHNRKLDFYTSIPESKYTVVGECWIWNGAKTKSPRGGPYGKIRQHGRDIGAHRWAYELTHGPIPSGLEPDHTCKNTLCINPAHIEAVTHTVNVQRSKKLNPDLVREIRNSDERTAVIADRINVSTTTILLVRSRKTWKNVD